MDITKVLTPFIRYTFGHIVYLYTLYVFPTWWGSIKMSTNMTDVLCTS